MKLTQIEKFLLSALSVMAATAPAAGGISVDPAQDRHWDRRFSVFRSYHVRALVAEGNKIFLGELGFVRSYENGRMETIRSAVFAGKAKARECATFSLTAVRGDQDPNSTTWCPDSNGAVNALAIDRGNRLYAAGRFENVDRQAISNIAMWNGKLWQSLTTGVDGEVFALAVFDDRLIVGGRFTHAGGEPAENIAIWNIKAGAWETLPGLCLNDFDRNVTEQVDAAVLEGRGINIRCDPSGRVNTLLIHEDGFLAGGEFTRAGIGYSNRIARYRFSDSKWHAMSSNRKQAVNSLATDHGELYAVSQHSVARWDGRKWVNIGAWKAGELYAAYANKQGLIVGGKICEPANTRRTNCPGLIQWNGVEWKPLPSPVALVIHAVLRVGNRLYVGGDFTGVGYGEAPGAAYFENARWHSLILGGVTLIGVDAKFRPVATQVITIAEDPNHRELWLSAFVAGKWIPQIKLFDLYSNTERTSETGELIKWIDNGPGKIYLYSHIMTKSEAAIGRISKWNGKSLTTIWSGQDNIEEMTADDSNLCAIMQPRDQLSERQNIQCWNGTDWRLFAEGVKGVLDNQDNHYGEFISEINVQDGWLYAWGNLSGIDGQPIRYIGRNNMRSRKWEDLGSSFLKLTDSFGKVKSLDGKRYAVATECCVRIPILAPSPVGATPTPEPLNSKDGYEWRINLLRWNGVKREYINPGTCKFINIWDYSMKNGWLIVAGDIDFGDGTPAVHLVAIKDGRCQRFGSGPSKVDKIYPVPDGLILALGYGSPAEGASLDGIAWWHGPVPPAQER